ncbi:PepSY-associated TM helix domain-containing protein [uncultured Hyphomicrobium sp.]|uniref:PepSY-associated TM helix domain-containing protein n=1 Tax=uncultured Hyphomicrobium sp. TaxID=194373 RepID=UPI0025E589ED|nr:PepSY-associated TM helix domain-containing protein [uncultured Hyphomicrobium sp.]
MRTLFTIVHRWAGLFIAVFLFIAGVTGAVISWDHELDEWLNPHLYDARTTGAALSPYELVRRVEAADSKIRVTYFPLSFEEGHNADLFVEPRVDAKTGELYAVDYNQVFIDPASGEVAGKRFWGAISLDSENILPFLYKLHYSMHIPDFWGIDRWGYWFMGIVGIVWMFDCFVGFYLTLPRRAGQSGGEPDETVNNGAAAVAPRRTWWQRWKPAWMIKRGASAYRRNLDLHRAFGLWLWAALFILAFTSISMNLTNEVVRPILSLVSSLTPDAFDDRAPTALNEPVEPVVTFPQAVDIASAEARRRGWEEPAGSAFYGVQYGLYSISFFHPGEEHGAAGMIKMLFLDAATGAMQGGRVPWEGTAADIFMQLQFPLHSGRIAGVPGRVFLSFMGLVVALLSATGIVIWLKKRAGRIGRKVAGRQVPEARAEPVAR